MDKLSKLSKLVNASGIRKAFSQAKDLKAPINLSIGQPDFKTPNDLKSNIIKAINNDNNSYTQTDGNTELLRALRNHLKSEKNQNLEGKKIMITSGVSGGIDLLFRSITNKDDEIILPDPYFVIYKNIILLNDAKPVYVDTYPDFQLTADQFKKHITNKTKAIVINSPANPTGKVYSKKELMEIADIARKNDILIISDEIYEDFVYNGKKHYSISDYYDNTIVLNGFSKSLGITGWRVGYAYGPEKIIEEMIKLQQFTYVCSPSISQAGIIEFVENKPKELKLAIKRYEKNSKLIYQELKDQYELNQPEGAFYFFAKIPKKYKNSEDFVKKCIENNLIIVPGNVFSEKDTHFRISFAANEKTVKKGIEILKNLA